MARKQRSSEPSPLDNNVYNIITVLHEKAKGLEAFEKYMEDASDDEELTRLFEQTREYDSECIRELQSQLARRIQMYAEATDDEEVEDDEDEQDEEVTSSRGRRSGRKS